jgi:hypothetical protein
MAMANADATPARRAARLREPVLRLAHLLTLSAFAVAQPLFDVLGRNAEFFVVRGSTAADIVLFALAVTFGPAIVFFAAELAASALDARAGLAVHLLFVAFLIALFAIQALERLGVDGSVPLIAGALAAGMAGALAVSRARLVGSFLTILTPAPAVFLGIFLLGSPVRELILPGEVDVAAAGVSASTPVVVVVFDELPTISLLNARNEIDARRYPSFARLARESIWFRNATTVSDSTTAAVPALVSGRVPREGALPVFQDHPRNLFTLLGGSYALNVRETQTRLCPPELCEREGPATSERLESLWSDARIVYAHLVAPPALEERLPPVDEAWGNFGREELDRLDGETSVPKTDPKTFHVGRVRELERFIASIGRRGVDAPSLDFLHVLLPHGPWLYFPSGRVSAVANARAPGRRGEHWWDEGLALQAYQRHLLQLGFTDRFVGALLRRLRRTGLLERALVVVTSDHGISFRGGDERRDATPANLQDLAFVPLFVRLPGGRDAGRVVDAHVRIVDVLPTIADALGVALRPDVDGRSALAPGFRGTGDVRIPPVSAPFEEALAARDDAVARQVALFGTGDWEIFDIGPYGDLVGRPVSELALRGRADGEAVVDAVGSRLVRSLPSRSGAVPSPLAGTLSGGVAKGDSVAVALNGRIAAVCRAYQGADGVTRFSALAPESAFRPGRNEPRFFLVEGAPGSPALHELSTRLAP